jgi:hypothetical protein
VTVCNIYDNKNWNKYNNSGIVYIKYIKRFLSHGFDRQKPSKIQMAQRKDKIG